MNFQQIKNLFKTRPKVVPAYPGRATPMLSKDGLPYKKPRMPYPQKPGMKPSLPIMPKPSVFKPGFKLGMRPRLPIMPKSGYIKPVDIRQSKKITSGPYKPSSKGAQLPLKRKPIREHYAGRALIGKLEYRKGPRWQGY